MKLEKLISKVEQFGTASVRNTLTGGEIVLDHSKMSEEFYNVNLYNESFGTLTYYRNGTYTYYSTELENTFDGVTDLDEILKIEN